MSAPILLQVCADRGIAPGSTKGAALHLRGVAAGLISLGLGVTTYSARPAEGDFPVVVRRLDELTPETAAGADAIYERYSLGHRSGFDVARLAGVPFVLEVNAPLLDEARTHRPDTVSAHHQQVETLLLHEADLVITVSPQLAKWVGEHRAGPTMTITNGFEPDWFQPTRVDPACETLAFLGHPKAWHGADRLPSLLVDLDRAGRTPSLLIIGGGEGANRILTEARQLGVHRQVTVTGPLSPQDASALLGEATIGLAPYPRHDPFYFCPLKVIDYLAAGLPIVSTNQGEIPALVGNAGIVVEPEDDEGLARAVLALLDDPSWRSRLGEAGRRRAHDTMTWRHAAATTVAALARLGTSAMSMSS